MPSIWTIRRGGDDDLEAVLAIARELPEWFTARGLAHMSIDLRFQPFVVGLDEVGIGGFASVHVAEGLAWIGWLGVAPRLQRGGLGRALVERVFAELAAAGVAEVRVDTLGDSVEYAPYAKTRAFYRSLGFVEHARVQQDDPEWPDRLTLRRPL